MLEEDNIVFPSKGKMLRNKKYKILFGDSLKLENKIIGKDIFIKETKNDYEEI